MIRPAAPEEAATLTQLALDAKRYWGYPEDWIKHSESDLTLSSDFIRDNQVYVAEQDGEIRGFYALGLTGLDHLWVRPESGAVSKELLLDAMERLARNTKST